MYNEKVNKRTLSIVSALGIMLLAATVLSVGTNTENVFAYKKSQASTGTNECGNGDEPFNILCQNLLSQIQGDGNALNIIGLQTGGGEKSISPPGRVPDTCDECWVPLISAGWLDEFARAFIDECRDLLGTHCSLPSSASPFEVLLFICKNLSNEEIFNLVILVINDFEQDHHIDLDETEECLKLLGPPQTPEVG